MVEIGQEIKQDGVIVKIVEVFKYLSGAKRRKVLISYRIIDGNFESDTAHIDMFRHEKLGEKIEEVVAHYKKMFNK